MSFKSLYKPFNLISILEYENVPKDWPIHMHAFTNSWAICQEWAETYSGMKFGLISDHFDPDIVRYVFK